MPLERPGAPIYLEELVSTHINDLTWRQTFMGRHPNNIYLMVDPGGLGKPRGQLRALPLLRELGLTRFSYSRDWRRKLQLVSHDYLPPGQEHAIIPHAVFISYSEELNTGCARTLIEQYQDAKTTEPMVIVVDTDTFRLRGHDKYLKDAPPLGGRVFHYERILPAYLGRQDIRSPLPLSATLNLAFHRLAVTELQATGREGRSLTELFTSRKPRRASPLWAVVQQLPWEIDVDELAAAIRHELLPWEERGDVMQVSQNLKYLMSLFHYDAEELREWLAGGD